MPRKPKPREKAPSDRQLLRAIYELRLAPRRTPDLAALLGCSVPTAVRVLRDLREGETADLVRKTMGAELVTEEAGRERWHSLRAVT